MTETDIQKIAETLRTELGKIDVEVSFRRKDFRKFFVFAIAANVISSTLIMTTIGYLARSDTKKKEEESKENKKKGMSITGDGEKEFNTHLKENNV